jgi:hypothetical protein
MATTAPKKLSTLSDRIERAYELKDQIDAIKLSMRPYQDELEQIESDIQAALTESGIEMARAEAGSYFLKHTTKPTVVDWARLDKFIIKTGATELLTRSLSTTAWRERAEAGETVPGVETENVTVLSSRRATKKK